MTPRHGNRARVARGRAAGGRAARGRAARRRGYLAEAWAVLYLRLCGYHVIERNWRSKLGEIDVLARKGRTLCLIEVKTRADAGLAGGALLHDQRRRLLRALGHYLKARPHLAELDLRCDVVAIGRFGWPVHLKDAWRADF